jgi:hypothetical protein
MRRIITGHNQEGRSIITLDGPPARSIGEDVGGKMLVAYLRYGTLTEMLLIQQIQLIEQIVILSYPHHIMDLSLDIFK